MNFTQIAEDWIEPGGPKEYRYGDALGGVHLSVVVAVIVVAAWDLYGGFWLTQAPLTQWPLLFLIFLLWQSAKYYLGPRITVDSIGLSRETKSQRTQLNFEAITHCSLQRRWFDECLVIEFSESKITVHALLPHMVEIVQVLLTRCPSAWTTIPLPHRIALRPFGAQTVVASFLFSFCATILVGIPVAGKDNFPIALAIVWSVVCLALAVSYKLRRDELVLCKDSFEYGSRNDTQVYKRNDVRRITWVQYNSSLSTEVLLSDGTSLKLKSARIPGSSCDLYRILCTLYSRGAD